MTKTAIVLFLLAVALIYTMFNSYHRHYYAGDNQLYRALHIALPGYETSYYPEQTVDLSKWVGTKYAGLIAVNTSDNIENSEVTAGLALKSMGLYTDYEFKQRPDKHYVLHRPAKKVRYFTWSVWYKIGPGELVKV